MNGNTAKRPATIWLFVILIAVTSSVTIFRSVAGIATGAFPQSLRTMAIFESVAHLFLLLSAASLFYQKKISFLLALVAVGVLLGNIWFSMGLAGLILTFISPIGLSMHLLPIALALYAGILFFRHELS